METLNPKPTFLSVVWEAEVVGTSMEEMRAGTRATTGASFAGSSPPFLGRERAAVGVERIRSAPSLAREYHEIQFN